MVIGLQVTEIELTLLTCFHVAPGTMSDGKKGLNFLRNFADKFRIPHKMCNAAQ